MTRQTDDRKSSLHQLSRSMRQSLSNKWAHQPIGLAIFIFSQVGLSTIALTTTPASAQTFTGTTANLCYKANTELDLDRTTVGLPGYNSNANTKAKLSNPLYFGTNGTAAPESFNFVRLTTVDATTLGTCQIYLGGGGISNPYSDPELSSTERTAIQTWLTGANRFLVAGCDYATPNQICDSFRTLVNYPNGGVGINSALAYNPLTCGGALDIESFGGVSSYFTTQTGDAVLGLHDRTTNAAVITDSLTAPKFLFSGDADMFGSGGASSIGTGATATSEQAKFVVNSFKFALDGITGRRALNPPPCATTYGAKVVMVKRITGIKPVGSTTWIRTTNPNDNITSLNMVVHNPADTANNDTNPRWPSNYLVGAYNAGKIKPGDELEYTIYYLNTQGSAASSVNICDPIRGKQTYVADSMQMLPGGTSTAIALTDSIDGRDRAKSYSAASVPTTCNAGNSTVVGTNNGGVNIEIVGTGSTMQPDLTRLSAATVSSTPSTSYGWFRFVTRVDP
jgi:hypothetical protein